MEIAHKHIRIGQRSNIKNYNKKVKGIDLTVGDKVLLRNTKEKGGTGKLRSYWEDVIYKIVAKDSELPVYTIQSDKDTKSIVKRVHRNNITNCNFLLPEKVVSKNHTSKTTIHHVPHIEKHRVVESSAESSDEEFLIRENFSSGEDEDDERINIISPIMNQNTDIENVVENIEDEDVDSVVDVEEKVDSIESVEEENDEINTESDDEEETDQINQIMSDENNMNSSSDSDREEIRRSRRSRKQPTIFTYEKIGGNPSQVFR